MSDFSIIIIPEDPRYSVDEQKIAKIKSLSWFGDNTSIIVNEKVQFADAGANFEHVACPFCKTALMDWWGGAMDEAYSEEAGFNHLGIITPCCHKETSLNDLEYYFPQGFYTTMIEMQPFSHRGVFQVPQESHIEMICQELFQITNKKWRIINRH